MIKVITQTKKRINIGSYYEMGRGVIVGIPTGRPQIEYISLGIYESSARVEEVMKQMDEHIHKIRIQDLVIARGIDVPITSLLFQMPEK